MAVYNLPESLLFETIKTWNCGTGCKNFWMVEGILPSHCPYCGATNITRQEKEEWEDSDIAKWYKKKVGKL